MVRNYTQNAWQGSQYEAYKSISDIAKDIRAELKKKFLNATFSVRSKSFSGGSALSVDLITWNHDVLRTDIKQVWESSMKAQHSFDTYEYFESFIKSLQNGGVNYDVNHYYIMEDYILTEKAREMLEEVRKTIQAHNYDDSDSMIDYHDTNFYLTMAIGKSGKPFQKI